MKKALAVLMLAAMILSTGCGNQAQDAAKDAQQKVEQTADAAKDKANQAADDAAKKADEMKSDAAAKVDEAKDAANQAADDVAKKADEMKSDAAAKVDEMATDMTSIMNERVIALNGLMPGASVEDVQAMFGEATKVEGNEMTFADGLKVVFDGAKKVKSISTVVDTFETPEGMYVGASEYSLNDNCGPADSVRKIANGAEYEYNSGDKKSIVVYKAENGIITEITCTLK
ncbi:MAG: hypothetical protein IKI76_07250 [Selenomonadaceae bacterium]|nr:hypothetical protein [Selenomonadaceae bacterium]